ncbi:MAG TPA: hypothetical protein VF040_14720 [Ktedonobacterales bacterium]
MRSPAIAGDRSPASHREPVLNAPAAICARYTARRGIPRVVLVLVGGTLTLILLGLAACSAPLTDGPSAHATATAQAVVTATAVAQATRAAQPVLLAMRVARQGTLAQGNAHLVVTLTVTNQTDQTIHITGPGCRIPPLVFEIRTAKQTLWASWIAESCPSNTPLDYQSLAAGSTYSTTIMGDLSKVTRLGVPKLQAGVTYSIVGKLWIWHQGTLAQLDQPGIPSGSDVTVTLPYTLQ